ncbi:MAG: ATP synthase F0 subunit C [Kiritimatiellae bacterium]|nr:ATP synthase F0 subunit C [Kiritimatiellia bacterium]
MLPLASSAFSALGASLTVIGAAIGIGWLWAVGLQSMARQPELQPKISVSMLIGAAFVEAVALFALVICFMQI